MGCVLVIDDGKKVTRSMAILLRSMGHEVVEFGDAVEGLSMALDGEFSAILVNLAVLKRRRSDFLRAERWGGSRNVQVMVYRGWMEEDAEHQIRYLRVQKVHFDPGSLAEIVSVLEDSPHTDWLSPHQAFKTRLRKTLSA